jgi:hypothetical protein
MSDLPDRKNAERVKVGMNTGGAIFVKTPESLGQNGNDSGERILPGIPENIKQSLLKIRDQNLDQKDNSSLRKFWEMLNDENLLPPKGKRLLPNPETLLTEGFEISKILFLAFAILNSGIDTAKANEIENKQIAWAIEATQNLDVINAFANRVSNNQERKQDQTFTQEEINLLTWNVFHEAGGEPNEGQLGVLLTCLERMKSPNYGATAEEVIFKNRQFTWTHNLNKFSNIDRSNSEIKNYLKIRSEIEKILTDPDNKTLDDKIKKVRGKIIKLYNDKPENTVKITKLPERLTHYQVYKLMESSFASEPKSGETLTRIKRTENYFNNEKNKAEPGIIKLGSQIFYPEYIANQL